ncbi:hypothetical protein I6Y99_004344 [Vibrio parahaemolyticus]|nr:hypothetical protein [Vibrio parahaemolyticus]
MFRNKEELIKARKELAAIGFNAGVRRICLTEKCSAEDVCQQLSKITGWNDIIFNDARKYGLPEYLVDEVLNFFNSKDLRFYRHQLWPTKGLIQNHLLSKIEGSAV